MATSHRENVASQDSDYSTIPTRNLRKLMRKLTNQLTFLQKAFFGGRGQFDSGRVLLPVEAARHQLESRRAEVFLELDRRGKLNVSGHKRSRRRYQQQIEKVKATRERKVDEAKLQAHLTAKIEKLEHWLDRAQPSNRQEYRRAIERKQLLESELDLSKVRQILADVSLALATTDLAQYRAQLERIQRFLDRPNYDVSTPHALKLIEAKQRIEQRIRESASLGPAHHVTAPSSKATHTKGLKELGSKRQDLSEYLESPKLTDRQRNCMSLRFEYDLSIKQISQRLGIHRKTVDEHLKAAESALSREKNAARRAKKRAIHPSLQGE